jgi:hypothetical protein
MSTALFLNRRKKKKKKRIGEKKKIKSKIIHSLCITA